MFFDLSELNIYWVNMKKKSLLNKHKKYCSKTSRNQFIGINDCVLIEGNVLFRFIIHDLSHAVLFAIL